MDSNLVTDNEVNYVDETVRNLEQKFKTMNETPCKEIETGNEFSQGMRWEH